LIPCIVYVSIMPIMTEYKLKVKIGEFEFEAEGPVETVKAQFEAFKELIKPSVNKTENSFTEIDRNLIAQSNPNRLFSLKNHRVVALTDHPNSTADAILLILHGQQQCRNNNAATGGEIKDGLEGSGYNGQEVSRRLRELRHEKLIAVSGSHRAKRYQLTNEGLLRVKAILQEMPKLARTITLED
jgi:hypothetical protein